MAYTNHRAYFQKAENTIQYRHSSKVTCFKPVKEIGLLASQAAKGRKSIS